MRLLTQRLELAFQFVFLIDSSGPAAVEQAAELVAGQVRDRRAAVRAQLEAWCSIASNSPAGVHGDSEGAIASVRDRFSEALYGVVGSMLQFEADKAGTAANAPRTDAGGLEGWREEFHDAFSRAVRDQVTVSAGRRAVEPLFEAADAVFGEAAAVVEEAVVMAREAMQRAAQTDRITLQLAPTWPAHRQAATDRAILRLGRSEMIAGRTPAKWVVHHCVNLAKRYSTEKSPAFVNALLDKVLKQELSEAGGPEGGDGPAVDGPEPA